MTLIWCVHKWQGEDVEQCNLENPRALCLKQGLTWWLTFFSLGNYCLATERFFCVEFFRVQGDNFFLRIQAVLFGLGPLQETKLTNVQCVGFTFVCYVFAHVWRIDWATIVSLSHPSHTLGRMCCSWKFLIVSLFTSKFVEKNRRDVEEKSNKLKAISDSTALFRGFVTIILTQFSM